MLIHIICVNLRTGHQQVKESRINVFRSFSAYFLQLPVILKRIAQNYVISMGYLVVAICHHKNASNVSYRAIY